MAALSLVSVLALSAAACGDDDGGETIPDGSVTVPDASDYQVSTDHCQYAPMAATARAGGTVTAGALQAGAAEAPLLMPVGTALGSFTERANFLGTTGKVDLREIEISGGFNPSIGVETRNHAKALALRAGGETVVIIKVDQGYPSETHVFDVEQRLGPDYYGKVIIAASHSHSAFGQHSAHSMIGQIGSGPTQQLTYDRYIDTYVAVAQAAIAGLRPARIGFFHDGAFDPGDQLTRDRRDENDALSGGQRDDNHLFLIRVDDLAGDPIAIVPIFGVHGTLQGADNSFAHTDAPGALERVVQEQFDRQVVVMHLQGVGADVSPVGHGGVDCGRPAGDPADPCFEWAKSEGFGRLAAPVVMAAWQQAGKAMLDQLAIEMVTRSVALGPDPRTFSVRGGALEYAAFDNSRSADRTVWNGNAVASPIDEFNAPTGASLCQEEFPLFPIAQLPGVDGLPPYGSCAAVDRGGPIIGELLELEFDSDVGRPVCQSTRTTLSALRLGDYLVGTMPGEISTLVADRVRASSPVAGDQTILLGYSQGEVGYLLTPEDWLQGGYEPSINFWGPLEGEYLVEQLAPLLGLAVTDEREDGAEAGRDRFATPTFPNRFTVDQDPTDVGTVPDTLPDRVWLRTGPRANPQPEPTIARVAGLAQFAWIGADPLASTPVVTLQRETAPDSGEFVDVQRRSGRPVLDGDLVLAYTPLPLRPDPGEDRIHYWSVEWQAVPWLGSAGLDDLDARARVPLGRYRFHVVDSLYTLDSDPFEVVPANLKVTASRSGATIAATVELEAPKGFRLLDLSLPSNRPVPLRGDALTVTLTLAGGGTQAHSATTDSDGRIQVDAGASAADVVSVTVADAEGNAGTAGVTQ